MKPVFATRNVVRPAVLGLLGIVFLIIGCGRNEATSLAPYGVNAEIELPDGATVEVEPFSSDLLISEGSGFRIRLSSGSFDLGRYAESIATNEVNRLVDWLKKSDDILHYESEIAGKSEFHFAMNLEVDGDVYLCKDDETEISYTSEEVERMINACQTLGSPQE